MFVYLLWNSTSLFAVSICVWGLELEVSPFLSHFIKDRDRVGGDSQTAAVSLSLSLFHLHPSFSFMALFKPSSRLLCAVFLCLFPPRCPNEVQRKWWKICTNPAQHHRTFLQCRAIWIEMQFSWGCGKFSPWKNSEKLSKETDLWVQRWKIVNV